MSLSRSYKKFIKVISRLNLYNNSSNKGINNYLLTILFINIRIYIINFLFHLYILIKIHHYNFLLNWNHYDKNKINKVTI